MPWKFGGSLQHYPDIPRLRAHLHLEGPRLHRPVFLFRAPVGERVPIQPKRDRLGFAGLQFHAAKCLQFVNRPIDKGGLPFAYSYLPEPTRRAG